MALLDLSRAPHGGRQRHLPEWDRQPKIIPTTIIDHSIVGSGESAFRHFAERSALESHFIVCGAADTNDGAIWQLMDTGRQADANLAANAYAISIETGDQGDPDRQPWTPAQLESLAWLHNELVRVHPTIPRRRSRSCLVPDGLGYHTLHGAPSCWTPVAKSCPGTVRKAQWFDVLLPAFLDPIPEGDDDMTPEQAAQLDQLTKDVAALKKLLARKDPDSTSGALLDNTWLAWRRLDHGNEHRPDGPAENLAHHRELLEEILAAVSPPPPPPDEPPPPAPV